MTIRPSKNRLGALGRTLTFVDLDPGQYDLEIAVSTDGRQWSAEPLRIRFAVDRPASIQKRATALYLLLVMGIGSAIYRARAAHLTGLERQRARIAIDLHDELGSGLGSIGLLSGVLPKDGASGEVAGQIGETASELGLALTDIVWALRPHSEEPETLLAYLKQRGHNLFPDGVRFRVDAPEHWPTVALSLPVRRCVSAIALEALYNAAKYARATEVTLVLHPGDRWRMEVRDNGTGIDPDAAVRPGGGVGLEGMHKRAAEIGGALTVDSTPAGTRITLLFDP